MFLNKLNKNGSSLLEVMVSLAILGILTAAIYSGLNNGNVATAIAAQHSAAFALCKERLEQMRGADFGAVTTDDFPQESIVITHRGGMSGEPINGTISNTIQNMAKPARKQIHIRLTWDCAGKSQEEELTGEILDRDALSSENGYISGWVQVQNLNKPYWFRLWKRGGGVIKNKDLRDPSFTGWNGYATRVKFYPKGSGVQTSLHYNFQPYPISNANKWIVRSNSSMSATLVKSSSNHKWYLYLSGTDTVLTSR